MRLFLASLLAALSLSCGSSSDFGDAPSASGAQVTDELAPRSASSEAWVVVVDDTSAGSQLRAQLSDSFAAYDAELKRARGNCGIVEDPANFEPIDRSLIVVYASQDGDARFVSAAQDPGLRWQSASKQDSDRVAWLKSVQDALETVPAAPGDFRPLEAIASISALLAAQRLPNDDAERALLASLPSNARFSLILAVAQDDASTADAASFALTASDSLTLESVIAPPLDARCAAPTPRLARWAAAQNVEPQLWSCGTVQPLAVADLDCAGAGPARTIAGSSDGEAECRAFSGIDAAAPCPADLGWLDPLDNAGNRTPRTHTENGARVRDCEIHQLTGSALDACRSQLDCAGCEPGWCMSKVPSLTMSSNDRSVSGTPIAPRFVLGANRSSFAIRLTCNLAVSTPAGGGE